MKRGGEKKAERWRGGGYKTANNKVMTNRCGTLSLCANHTQMAHSYLIIRYFLILQTELLSPQEMLLICTNDKEK